MCVKGLGVRLAGCVQWDVLFVVLSCTWLELEGLRWWFVSALPVLLASPSPGVNVCPGSVSIAQPALFGTTSELLLTPVAFARASPCLTETLIPTPAFPGLITLIVPSLHCCPSWAQRHVSSFWLGVSELTPSPLLRASVASSVLTVR